MLQQWGTRCIGTIQLCLLVCFSMGVALLQSEVSFAVESGPKGIFISGGRYQQPAVLKSDFVDGALIRVRWSVLEPRPGQFDWGYLEGEIAKVKKAGKKYTLAVVSGPSAPQWLYDELSVPNFTYSFNSPYGSKKRSRSHTLPLPWDAQYLERWFKVIEAVGARYNDDPDLYLVHITNSSQNGFEMQLPMSRGARGKSKSNVPDWSDYGFSRAKYVTAVKKVMDAFAEAFPRQFLDLEIHSVLKDSTIPAELVDYGASTIGKRFGPFGAWLNNRETRWDKPLRKVMAKYGETSFCNYQLIGNETRQVERIGPGGLKAAVELGVSQGCKYYEIWEIDLKNDALKGWLSETQRMLNAKH